MVFGTEPQLAAGQLWCIPARFRSITNEKSEV